MLQKKKKDEKREVGGKKLGGRGKYKGGQKKMTIKGKRLTEEEERDGSVGEERDNL